MPEMDDDDFAHDTKDEAMTSAFYGMDAGNTMAICSFSYPCPHHVENQVCELCRIIEKKPGDTLAEFLQRCNQLT